MRGRRGSITPRAGVPGRPPDRFSPAGGAACRGRRAQAGPSSSPIAATCTPCDPVAGAHPLDVAVRQQQQRVALAGAAEDPDQRDAAAGEPDALGGGGARRVRGRRCRLLARRLRRRDDLLPDRRGRGPALRRRRRRARPAAAARGDFAPPSAPRGRRLDDLGRAGRAARPTLGAGAALGRGRA